MSNAIATANRVREISNAPASMALDVEMIERVITGGDLSTLSPKQRVEYYVETCESLGVNWRTKPFDMVRLRTGGPMILYPNKGLAEQFAGKYGISAESVRSDEVKGIYREWVRASLPSGRSVTKMGAVPIEGIKGNDLANAYMKTETKAFRRAVLALVGLNMLDPSELDTIPGAQRADLDLKTGQIREQPGTVEASIVPPDEDVDYDTGEITAGQQGFPAGIPENGTDMMSSHQRGEILYLAEKLGWTNEQGAIDAAKINALAGDVTGISNVDNLSSQRAGMVISAMREKRTQAGKAS